MIFNSLRQKLNDTTKSVGNRLYDGLGDILSSDITPRIPRSIVMATAFAGAMALGSGCGGGGGGDGDETPKIICNTDYFTGGDDVATMNEDGTELTEVATPGFAPKWNPVDRSQIIATRKHPTTTKYCLYTADADGANETLLTDGTFNDYRGTLSPDGTKVAFMSDRDGTLQVYTMNADGSEQQRLDSSSDNKEYPVWSSDGFVYYNSYKTNNLEICRKKADGSGSEENLTNNSADDYQCSVSPDGSKVVFSSDRDSYGREIYKMNADGTAVERLTDSPNQAGQPDFSPDGTKIVYCDWCPSPETSDLWIVNADGSDSHMISDGVNNYWESNW